MYIHTYTHTSREINNRDTERQRSRETVRKNDTYSHMYHCVEMHMCAPMWKHKVGVECPP